MKNILFLLFLTLPLFAFTQNATKWQQKNSDKISNYVINKMNLNKKAAALFSKVQLAQIVENANNIKESGASSAEEKKAIYSDGYSNINAKLNKRFGNKLAQEILKVANEARKQWIILFVIKKELS